MASLDRTGFKDDHFKRYLSWLERQPLSSQSRRAYKSRINLFLGFLESSQGGIDSLLARPKDSQYILREYKHHLKVSRKFRPTSVNATLTAVDHFYQFLGLPAAGTGREDLPQEAPRSLSSEEQKRFMLVVKNQRRALDRAVPLLMINTGIRVGECAALNLDDVCVAGRKAQIVIRSGKGERYREIPLNEEARDAVRDWILERNQRFAEIQTEEALFLNPQGRRMSATSIDRIIRKCGEICGIDLSSHVLRHTCLTNLVRKGHDLVLVAEIGGHKRLDTTRRYSLPAKEVKEQAMESLLI